MCHESSDGEQAMTNWFIDQYEYWYGNEDMDKKLELYRRIKAQEVAWEESNKFFYAQEVYGNIVYNTLEFVMHLMPKEIEQETSQIFAALLTSLQMLGSYRNILRNNLYVMSWDEWSARYATYIKSVGFLDCVIESLTNKKQFRRWEMLLPNYEELEPLP